MIKRIKTIIIIITLPSSMRCMASLSLTLRDKEKDTKHKRRQQNPPSSLSYLVNNKVVVQQLSLARALSLSLSI